jgi:predicted MFS family arabinose efflux permease
MNPSPSLSPSPAHVAVSLAIGSIALLVLGLQPILLGELLESHRVSLEGVGLVAMAEIVALGLGVLLGDLTQPLARLRGVTAVAALAAAALDAATLRASGDLGFTLVRAAAGVAEGLLVWSTTAVVVRSSQPDRAAGVFFVLQTLLQAALGLVLARAVIPAGGWAGAFLVLAGLSLAPVAAAGGLPARLAALAPATVSGFTWSVRTVLPLAVAFLQLAALAALWAYLEPLGRSAGFSATSVQTLIAAGLGMQVLGGCAGSALVKRLTAVPTLALGAVVLAGAVLGMRQASHHTDVFALLCALFAFAWLFLLPFQMRLAFDADPSGRVGSLLPAAQLFGTAFGPLIASLLVDGDNAASVPAVSAAFAVASIAALIAVRGRSTPFIHPEPSR